MSDKREHDGGDIGNISRGIRYTHHRGHVGMDFAMKQIDARQVELGRERPALRLVLIHDDIRAGGLHEKRDRVLRYWCSSY